MNKCVRFNELNEKNILSTIVSGKSEIQFECSDGTKYRMWHEQDCCECVLLEDITEGWEEILSDAYVVDAYESGLYDLGDSNLENKPLSEYDDSYTWTFYRITTNKGCVVIRWYGTSNGYYSESVDFAQIA